jgi:hypothetical protein
MPDVQPNPQTSTVDADLPCMQCGYNLRTQPGGGVCPECGVPIRHTISFPHLSRSAPRWVTSLLDSVTVLLVAFAIAVVCRFVFTGPRDTLPPLICIPAAWGTAWFAVWLLTRPEPGVRDFDAAAWGWTMRLMTTVGYVGIFVAVPIAHLAGAYAEVVLFLILVWLAPATCLYYNHLRRAARRLPSARLAWQAAALQLLLPLAMVVATARVLFQGRGPQSAADFMLRVPLVGVGSVGDAWMFFQIARAFVLLDWVPFATGASAVTMLWAVAVLVQFRIAFAAAVREAGGRSGQHPPATADAAARRPAREPDQALTGGPE